MCLQSVSLVGPKRRGSKYLSRLLILSSGHGQRDRSETVFEVQFSRVIGFLDVSEKVDTPERVTARDVYVASSTLFNSVQRLRSSESVARYQQVSTSITMHSWTRVVTDCERHGKMRWMVIWTPQFAFAMCTWRFLFLAPMIAPPTFITTPLSQLPTGAYPIYSRKCSIDSSIWSLRLTRGTVFQ
jgi:hypothetical protein